PTCRGGPCVPLSRQSIKRRNKMRALFIDLQLPHPASWLKRSPPGGSHRSVAFPSGRLKKYPLRVTGFGAHHFDATEPLWLVGIAHREPRMGQRQVINASISPKGSLETLSQ